MFVQAESSEAVSIYLVDDEAIILNGLRTQIDWEKIGITVCGFALNATEALEDIKRKLPDIIITDIKMPDISGLDLIRDSIIASPYSKYILLSGYGEFEYTSRAISLGVCEFLLKPVDVNVIINAVEKVRNQIIDERTSRNTRINLESQLCEGLPFLKNWFFHLLEHSNLNSRQILNKINHYKAELSDGFCHAVVVELYNADDQKELSCQKLLKVFHISEDILNRRGSCKFISFFETNSFIFLLSYAKSCSLKYCTNDVFGFAENLKTYYDNHLECGYCIGIGQPCNDFMSLSASYDDGLVACGHRFYMENNQIIYIKDVEPFKKENYHIQLPELFTRFTTAIKVGDGNNACGIITEILSAAKNFQSDDHKTICKELLTHMYTAVNEIYSSLGHKIMELNLWSEIEQKNSTELLNFMTSFVTSFTKQIHTLHMNKNRDIAQQVKSLIHEHYAEDIGLDWLSGKTFFSPCYISSVFSKQFGVTFKDYLIRVRIDEAKRLLLSGKYRIYEVSRMVGYSDQRYFSQLFKRYTGFTPVGFQRHSLNNTVEIPLKKHDFST